MEPEPGPTPAAAPPIMRAQSPEPAPLPTPSPRPPAGPEPVATPAPPPAPAVIAPAIGAPVSAPLPVPAPVAAPGPAPAAVVLAPTAAASAVRPRLMTMVAPDIPPRVYDQIGSLNEVVAEITIRRDGSVSGVNVLSPVPRAAMRYIIEALQRWRYEPLPAEQVLRVQLVFNGL